MFINIYKKIQVDNKAPQFSMPLSLRIIKVLGQEGIDWRGLHIIDIISLYYSIMIDKANEYLQYKQKEKLQKRGISEIKAATVDDFDKL